MEILNSLQTDRFLFRHEAEEMPRPGVLEPIGYDPAYLLYYLVSGRTRCQIEGARFDPPPDSLILLRPGLFYGCELLGPAPFERYLFRFEREFVEEPAREGLLAPFHTDRVPERHIFSVPEEAPFASLFHLLDQLAGQTSHGEAASFHFAAHALLAALAESGRTRGAVIAQYAAREDMLPILKYINENLTGSLTLDSLAEKFFISKHHLNKVFRAAAGTTVMDYIIHKRVLLAREWITQGKSAAQAALRAGFSDYSAFYRDYKRVLGHAPGADKPGKILPRRPPE